MPRYYYPEARDTVESTKSLSIFWLNQKNIIPGNDSSISGRINWSINGNKTGDIRYEINISFKENSFIRLHYQIKSLDMDYDYKIFLVHLPCNLGGFRWYFKCINCNRTAGVIYLDSGYFVCRICANLSYESCNENKRFRSWPYSVISRDFKADKAYEKVKTKFYRGNPTKKYKRYLKLNYISEDEEISAINSSLE